MFSLWYLSLAIDEYRAHLSNEQLDKEFSSKKDLPDNKPLKEPITAPTPKKPDLPPSQPTTQIIQPSKPKVEPTTNVSTNLNNNNNNKIENKASTFDTPLPKPLTPVTPNVSLPNKVPKPDDFKLPTDEGAQFQVKPKLPEVTDAFDAKLAEINKKLDSSKQADAVKGVLRDPMDQKFAELAAHQEKIKKLVANTESMPSDDESLVSSEGSET